MNFVDKIDGIIFRRLGLIGRAFSGYKSQIFVLVVLGFFSGLLEGVGINALIPLFSFVVGGDAGGATDTISKITRSGFEFLHIDFNLKYLLVFMCSLFIIKAGVMIFCNYIRIRIMADYEERTRRELFTKTLRSSWSFLLKQKLGYFENVLMTDIRSSAALLQQISGIIMMITSLAMYIVVALNISIFITLLTVFIGGILFLIFKPFLKKTKEAAKTTSIINKDVAHFINENILGMKTIKTMAMEEKFLNFSKDFFSRLKELKIKVIFFKNLTSSLWQPVSLVFICIIFAITYKTPGFNFAVLLATIYLIQRIFFYIQQIENALHGIVESIPYLEHVSRYREQIEINQARIRGSEKFVFEKTLEFKDVQFSYKENQEILSGVNFSVNRGEFVGLIGPSGAGKTTIVDLILRLFYPTSGKILLDGKDIEGIDAKEWGKNVGYVSQDIFLKNDTIANNIKFYDDSISDEDMKEAAKMANIYEFIESCPDKFNSMIGERGIILSAGQRQRIVIARILVRKPKLLILDEATSALDNESEIKIQKVIENIKGRVTVLAIAHRLSTVINSDKLLVLSGGAIIEDGKPGDLLKTKESYFYKVYNIRK